MEGKAGQEQSQYNQEKKKEVQTIPVKQFHLITTHPHKKNNKKNIHISLFLKSMQIRYCISFCHKEISEAVLPPGCGVCLVSPTQ